MCASRIGRTRAHGGRLCLCVTDTVGSHSRTVLSVLADASRCPVGENSTAVTTPCRARRSQGNAHARVRMGQNKPNGQPRPAPRSFSSFPRWPADLVPHEPERSELRFEVPNHDDMVMTARRELPERRREADAAGRRLVAPEAALQRRVGRVRSRRGQARHGWLAGWLAGAGSRTGRWAAVAVAVTVAVTVSVLGQSAGAVDGWMMADRFLKGEEKGKKERLRETHAAATTHHHHVMTWKPQM